MVMSASEPFVLPFSVSIAAAPSGEFQEVEGESEDRRRARMERQQRTQERAVCYHYNFWWNMLHVILV